MLKSRHVNHRSGCMSNMKRFWEDEQERMLREAGMTQETLDKIEKWMLKKSKEEKQDD